MRVKSLFYSSIPANMAELYISNLIIKSTFINIDYRKKQYLQQSIPKVIQKMGDQYIFTEYLLTSL